MAEHTITVTAGIGLTFTEQDVLDVFESIEREPKVLGPAMSFDRERGTMTLTGTVLSKSRGKAEKIVTVALAEAMVAAGVVDEARATTVREAVVVAAAG